MCARSIASSVGSSPATGRFGDPRRPAPAERRRQVLGPDLGALADDDRRFDDVQQFAHVAGPVVPPQHVAAPRAPSRFSQPEALVQQRDEMAGQQVDVARGARAAAAAQP